MNKTIDFDRAFPPTPESIGRAMEQGFQRGRRAESRRRHFRLACVAAALVLALAAVLSGLPGSRQPADVLSQPELSLNTMPFTPTAQIPELQHAVYSDSAGAPLFHRNAACGGAEAAVTLPLESAIEQDLLPCPHCFRTGDLPGAALERLQARWRVYATPMGTYYHADPACSGMADAVALCLLDALALGKQWCPACNPRTFLLSEVPLEGPLSKSSSVYISEENLYYHMTDHCDGAWNKTRCTLEAAVEAGKTACPACMGLCAASAFPAASADTLFFATPNGSYYHSDPNCSGMQDARAITARQAQAAGKIPCPTCLYTGENLMLEMDAGH